MLIDAATSSTRAPRLLESVKDLGRTAIDILHTRFELLVTEIHEEQARIAEILLMAALSLLSFFLSIVFFAFLIVVAFWDSDYRVLATGLVALFLACVGGALFFAFIKKAKAKPKLFSESLDELGEDLERLK